MKVLALSCSLRKPSLNKKLMAVAAELLTKHGVEVDLAQLSEFDLPLLNWDLVEDNGGKFPAIVDQLRDRFLAADAFVLSTPEYNYSIAAPLKNAIDWLSRYRPMPFKNKPSYLMSASISFAGGIRGLWQTRIPLEGCGSYVYPGMFPLPTAHQKFDGDGKLTDQESVSRLDAELASFLDFAKRLTAK